MSDVRILKCHNCDTFYKWKSKDVGSMHFGAVGSTCCPNCFESPRLEDLIPGRTPDSEREQPQPK